MSKKIIIALGVVALVVAGLLGWNWLNTCYIKPSGEYSSTSTTAYPEYVFDCKTNPYTLHLYQYEQGDWNEVSTFERSGTSLFVNSQCTLSIEKTNEDTCVFSVYDANNNLLSRFSVQDKSISSQSIAYYGGEKEKLGKGNEITILTCAYGDTESIAAKTNHFSHTFSGKGLENAIELTIEVN